MRFVTLPLVLACCSGCIIQNTVIADTVGVKGDVNNQVESVSIAPPVTPPREPAQATPAMGTQHTPIPTVASQPTRVVPTTSVSRKSVREVQVGSSSFFVSVGKSVRVTATVRYTDGSSDERVVLTSDNASIVAIDAINSEVNGLRLGVANVRVAAAHDPDKFAVVQVNVRERELNDLRATVTSDKVRVAVNAQTSLSAEVRNGSDTVSNQGYWTSSDPRIASIHQTLGTVTGLRDGVVTATFTSSLNPSVKATVEVIVGDPFAVQPESTGTEQVTVSTTTVTTESGTSAQFDVE